MTGVDMRQFNIAAVIFAAAALVAGPAYAQMGSKGGANERAQAIDKMTAEEKERQDKQMRIDRAYKETVDKTSGAEQKVDPWQNVRPAPSNSKR